MHTDLEKKNIRKRALNSCLGKIHLRYMNSTLFSQINLTQQSFRVHGNSGGDRNTTIISVSRTSSYHYKTFLAIC